MRKVALILTLITLLPVLWHPVLGQKPSGGEKGTVKKPDGKAGSDQAGNSDQRGTKEFPLIVDAEGHQQTDHEKKEAATKEDRVREVERWTLYFAQLTAWATVVLVLVGICGTIAAVVTLRQIKRQANLMAVPYQTWVDYGKWNSYCKFFTDGTCKFEISFVVANRTQFPVTMKGAFVEFVPQGVDGMPGKRFQFRPDNRLLPGREPVDYMAWDISSTDFSEWEAGKLWFTFQVNGDLNHIGPLGPAPDDERRFYGILRCSKTVTRFEEVTVIQEGQQKKAN